MQNLYDFLKQKLKEKNVRVEDIVSRSGFSRTTVYRMMKGLLKPTPQVYGLFIDMLDLDERERHELDYYVRLIDVDESLLQARKELFEIIFRTEPGQANIVDDIEFIVYGGEKYIKTYKELLSLVTRVSQKPSFCLDVKIINCDRNLCLVPIVNMLSTDENLSNSVIEHLVSFSNNDSHKNILTLKAILPLMKCNNYRVFYSYEESQTSKAELFRDLMLVKYSYMEDNIEILKYMLLSFEKNATFGCYLTEDKGLYEFFAKRYAAAKEVHEGSLVNQKNIGLLSNTVYEFEVGGQNGIIKSTPCYHRIPIHVYQSMLSRQSENQRTEMINYLDGGVGLSYGSQFAVENILVCFSERDRLSMKYKQIDVYTKSGLEDFAKTRKLRDHFSFLPEYTGEEVKAILENLQKKSKSKEDKYRFYITYQAMSDEGMAYGVSERNGIILEYIDTQKFKNNLLDCIIKQDSLSKIFLDFVENYIPENLAMSEADADKFIEYLIETYCD